MFSRFSLPTIFGFLSVVGATEYYDHSANATQKCRYLPSDPQWPSQGTWAALNKTVQGRLIANVPMAHVCHDPTYDKVACDTLKATWTHPEPFEASPADIMSGYFQNGTCDPFHPRQTPCLLGNLASYSINVQTAGDVAAGFAFAHKNNIRLVVKNTGHEYNGKSTGKGALSLWTHNLRATQAIPKYNSSWYTGPAMKLGSGTRAWEAYQAAHDNGLMVVGGDCPTVGIAGGYIQGGGHSILSGIHGMAADNVVEWEIVLPNGEHTVANPVVNQDVYYAMSGGGGSTYAVALSVTLRAFPDGVMGGAAITFNRADMTNDTFWAGWTAYQRALPAISDSGAETAYAVLPNQFYLQAATRPGWSVAQMKGLMKPFVDDLNKLGIKYSYNTSSLPTFLDHYSHYFGPFPNGSYVVGELMGGRLFPRDVVVAKPQEISNAIRFITENTSIICGFISQDTSFNGTRVPVAPNSVLPGWRNSIVAILLQSYFDFGLSWAEKQALENTLQTVAQPRIDALTPGAGTDVNEANFAVQDWKEQFYGSNYNTLLATKKKRDPYNIMWGIRAVGSDEMELYPDGRLCYV